MAAIPVDADTDDQVLSTFLPGPQHQRALDRRTLVVRGERGAGKTALFKLLHAVERKKVRLSEIVPGAPDGRRIDGFAEQGTAHPPAEVVAQLAAEADAETLRAFWLGHLVGRLHGEGVDRRELPSAFASAYARPNDPAHWVPVARAQLADLYGWLDLVDRSAKEACFVVYDHLDRIGTTRREVREKVSSALLGLWFSLSQRYENIRGKVLLREDLFQATLTSFADATKLEARSVRLDWSAARLFALLVRRMGAAAVVRTWLQEVAGLQLLKRGHLGWMPSSPELAEREQRAFGGALVGPYMGAGPTKGATHTWLINHLQDAHQRVSPRSLLQLVRGAAELALERGPRAAYRRLLTPLELQQSLEHASLRRVNELKEDYPVVGRLEGLRDQVLFLERREVVRALGSVDLADGYRGNVEGAFEELMHLGVLTDRQGRIDVPDVYRYGFGIKRKGGARRVA